MMRPLKKFIAKQLIDFYFSKTNHENNDLHHWFLVAAYLMSILKFNIYIDLILLVSAMVHKLYTDTYITDRVISMTILMSTLIFFLKFPTPTCVSCILFGILLLDTVHYKKILNNRKLTAEYYNIEKYYMLMQEHEQQQQQQQEFDINCEDDVDEDNTD